MNICRKKYRAWIKIVATVVVCLISINTDTWPYSLESSHMVQGKHNLSRWSLVQDLRREGALDSAGVMLEAVMGFKYLENDMDIEFVNAYLREGADKLKRIEKIKFLEGVQREDGSIKAKFEVIANGKVMEVRKKNGIFELVNVTTENTIETASKEDDKKQGTNLWREPEIIEIEEDLRTNGLKNFTEVPDIPGILADASVGKAPDNRVVGVYKHQNGVEIVKKRVSHVKDIEEFLSTKNPLYCPSFFAIGDNDHVYELNLLRYGYRSLREKGPLTEMNNNYEAREIVKKALMEAFKADKRGFIHGHLHLGNILVRRNIQDDIEDIKIIDWKYIRRVSEENFNSILGGFSYGKKDDLLGRRISGSHRVELLLARAKDLTSSKLKNITFYWMDFCESLFRKLTLEALSFSWSDLDRSDFSNTKIKGIHISESNFREANFEQAKISGYFSIKRWFVQVFYGFRDKLKEGLSYVRRGFKKSKKDQDDRPPRKMKPSFWGRSFIVDSDFEGASFKGSFLSRVSFMRCNLKGVKFQDVRIEKVFFDNSNLEKADFRGIRGIKWGDKGYNEYSRDTWGKKDGVWKLITKNGNRWINIFYRATVKKTKFDRDKGQFFENEKENGESLYEVEYPPGADWCEVTSLREGKVYIRYRKDIDGGEIRKKLEEHYRANNGWEEAEKKADKILNSFHNSGIPSKFLDVLLDLEIAQRHKEFVEFYKTLDNPEQYTLDEMKGKFTDFMKERQANDKKRISEDTTEGEKKSNRFFQGKDEFTALMYAKNRDEDFLFKKAEECIENYFVNIYVDLSAVPNEEGQLERNMETLALQVALYSEFKLNIRFILENDQEEKAKRMLRDKLEKLAEANSMAKEKLLSNIGVPYTGNDIVKVMVKRNENIKGVHAGDWEFIIGLTDDYGATGIPVPNYSAAFAVGLSQVILRSLAEKTNVKDKFGKFDAIEKREKRTIFNRLERIYKRFNVIGPENTFTMEDLKLMVVGCPANKKIWAEKYALPPIVKDLVNKINKVHEIMQQILVAA
jgi:uncharacterized protein YjbI with pentapeptide repeats